MRRHQAEDFSKIDEAQSGFRPGYSTVDNLYCLMTTVQKYLSKKGGRFYFLFVDFSKAFDSISHEKLIKCLIRKGVGGKFLKLLISMYNDLCSCVKTSENTCTDYFDCNIGTRQGCKLSPILFSLFIDELVETLRREGAVGIQILNDSDSLIALLYADDVANLADTVRNLQFQLDILSRFCELSDMKINLSKTKIMVFRNGGYIRENEKWYFQGQKLEVVSVYKYMGLMITPKLIWTTATNGLATQANKSIISMLKMQHSVGYFDYDEYFKLFDTMIKPILCYASEIWGYQYSNAVERVHDQFCRKFLKLPSNTANIFVRGECGRWPLYIDYFCKCIKYWIRLMRMDTYRYPYQCYKMLRNLDEVGRITWATKVKELLYLHGFGYVWFYENVGDEKIFIKTFRQRLIDSSIQDWSSKLNESGKARHYRYIMPNFGLATYLKYNLPLKFRIPLSKLRCSVHNLLVETGRHKNIDYENRICVLCNSANIEDEFHFVMICPFYEDLRISFLSNMSHLHFTLEKFYDLFNGERGLVLGLSKYIYYAFERRNNFMKNMIE
ncbi:MAG: reverse transcriptase family protein [Candidatus Thiodiazotropha sp.]